MSLTTKLQVSYNTLHEHLNSTNVLLLHPRSKYRSVIMAMLINDPQVLSFYYAFDSDDISLPNFIESFTHDMATQHATFGRHLNMVTPDAYEQYSQYVDALLEALLHELRELSDDDYILILDEYDRSDDADDIHRFIERLADQLPSQIRLVLNSRTLPRLPWIAMVAKKQAVLLLDDHIIREDFYETYRDDNYDLEVYALGPSYVHYNGHEIEDWEGHLPRLLFFFALDKPIVTRSEICDAFWPSLDTDQAVNVFHVTKRRLHKALDLDVLVHQDTHYQINPELNVYYDVIDFAETLMRGRDPNNPDQFKAWQRATELYRGPFLQGHTDSWIEERRDAFRAGYLEALIAIAQTWIDKGRKEIALRLYRQALDEDFRREDFHRGIMQLYKDLGRRSEAVAHYRELEKIFKESGLPVSNETEIVYNAIVSE